MAVSSDGERGQEIAKRDGDHARNKCDEEKNVRRILKFLIWMLGACLGLVIFHVGTASGVITSAIWAFACFAVGSLLGFLFAIPRVRQQLKTESASLQGGRGVEQAFKKSSPDAKSEGTLSGGYQQGVNTNLEEISDWLTKILVGVTLVQINKVPAALDALGGYLATGLEHGGTPDSHEALATGVVISFSTVGFIFGYLATRFVIAPSLSYSDRLAISAIEKTESIEERLDTHSEAEAYLQAAMHLVIRAEILEVITEKSSLSESRDETVDERRRRLEKARDERKRYLEKARLCVDDALAVLPRNVRALDMLSGVYQRLGDWSNARSFQEAALANSPKALRARYRYNLACLYAVIGRSNNDDQMRNKALDELRKVFKEYDPTEHASTREFAKIDDDWREFWGKPEFLALTELRPDSRGAASHSPRFSTDIDMEVS